MPTLTAGSAASLLPVGALYYDITQERFPGDVTEDISTEIEVVEEQKTDPVNENPIPKGPTESSKEISETEEKLNTESMTTNETVGTPETNEASRDEANNEDITAYIDNDSLNRISNYKNIIKQFLITPPIFF